VGGEQLLIFLPAPLGGWRTVVNVLPAPLGGWRTVVDVSFLLPWVVENSGYSSLLLPWVGEV